MGFVRLSSGCGGGTMPVSARRLHRETRGAEMEIETMWLTQEKQEKWVGVKVTRGLRKERGRAE